MPGEQQIKELTHAIWEQEGRLEGEDLEHYFRAKKILEEQEKARVIELGPPPAILELPSPPPIPASAPNSIATSRVPHSNKGRKYTRRKKK
jgi:hypothetical protein